MTKPSRPATYGTTASLPGARRDTNRKAGRVGTASLRLEALARVVAIVRAATSDEVALAFAALVATRDGGARTVDLAAFARAAGLGDRLAAAGDTLYWADRTIDVGLGFDLFDARTRADLAHDGGLEDAQHPGGPKGDAPDLPADDPRRRLRLSAALVRLLDEPLPIVVPDPASANPASGDPASAAAIPVLDGDARTWVAALRAATAGSGEDAGGHLVLRCARPDDREVDDLAGALARDGVRVHVVDLPDLPLALLRGELHGGPDRAVILVAVDRLVDKPDQAEEDPGLPASGSSGFLVPTAFARLAAPWLALLRHVHVWRVPDEGRLAPFFDGLVGGCVGPLRRHDRAWVRGVLGAALPGIGDDGTLALARQAGDPRDLAAMARAARWVAAGSAGDLDAACAFVAGSFARERVPAPPAPADFDPRLLVCDPEALLLLERARALASNGGRVLAWGPPGGGKSSWARVLAARAAAGRPVVAVTPASILARPWGATERLLRGLWTRAADEGAVLLVDELDAMCAAREPGASGGNAYLIRCLTDEWLRDLDDHACVPVIATLNDVLAVDDAVRRRFAFVVRFGDSLPPERERLAWRVILHAEPPPGWVPIGASVADMALARARCRMLGLTDADALADAVARAREARLGPGRAGSARHGGSVH